jgi:hypothetical protein
MTEVRTPIGTLDFISLSLSFIFLCVLISVILCISIKPFRTEFFPLLILYQISEHLNSCRSACTKVPSPFYLFSCLFLCWFSFYFCPFAFVLLVFLRSSFLLYLFPCLCLLVRHFSISLAFFPSLSHAFFSFSSFCGLI